MANWQIGLNTAGYEVFIVPGRLSGVQWVYNLSPVVIGIVLVTWGTRLWRAATRVGSVSAANEYRKLGSDSFVIEALAGLGVAVVASILFTSVLFALRC
jgi:xanthine/uracil permease